MDDMMMFIGFPSAKDPSYDAAAGLASDFATLVERANHKPPCSLQRVWLLAEHTH